MKANGRVSLPQAYGSRTAEEVCVLGYHAAYSIESQTSYRRYLFLHLQAGGVNPLKIGIRQAASEAAYSSEISVDFHWTALYPGR